MTETIDLAAFNRLYPGQIVLSDDSRRLDGRADGKARELSLNLDTLRSTNGSCMCKLGGTVVMAGVRAKLSKVTHGELSLTLDVASFALSQMKQGQAAEIQATLSERLHGLLVGANRTSSDAFSQPPPLNSKGQPCHLSCHSLDPPPPYLDPVYPPKAAWTSRSCLLLKGRHLGT